jgi:DNA-binding winged helix-turn-helix (wHTH) protein
VSGGAKLIETVPKRGYRFLPVVTRIENAPPALVVHEKTVQRVVVEKTITIPDELVASAANKLPDLEPNTLHPALPAPKSEIRNRSGWRSRSA